MITKRKSWKRPWLVGIAVSCVLCLAVAKTIVFPRDDAYNGAGRLILIHGGGHGGGGGHMSHDRDTGNNHSKQMEHHGWHHLHGVFLGLALGDYMDLQEKSAAEATNTYHYRPEQGLIVRVEDARVEPALIEPGKASKLALTYSVLNPDSKASVSVTEMRNITVGEDVLKEIGPKVVPRTPGTFYSEQEVVFPQDLPDGTYTLQGMVKAGEKTSSKQTDFQVTKIAVKSGYMYAVRLISPNS